MKMFSGFLLAVGLSLATSAVAGTLDFVGTWNGSGSIPKIEVYRPNSGDIDVYVKIYGRCGGQPCLQGTFYPKRYSASRSDLPRTEATTLVATQTFNGLKNVQYSFYLDGQDIRYLTLTDYLDGSRDRVADSGLLIKLN